MDLFGLLLNSEQRSIYRHRMRDWWIKHVTACVGYDGRVYNRTISHKYVSVLLISHLLLIQNSVRRS